MRIILFLVISLILCVGVYTAMKHFLSPKATPQDTEITDTTNKNTTNEAVPQQSQQQETDIENTNTETKATGTELEETSELESTNLQSKNTLPIAEKAKDSKSETKFATPKVETKPAASKEETNSKAPYYTIVMSCFQNAKSAETAVAELAKQGLKGCFTQTSSKLTRVVYSRFKTKEEAAAKLRTLRSSNPRFKDSWVCNVQ